MELQNEVLALLDNWKKLISHPGIAGHLHACFAQTGCKYELKDAKKDKEDARHHPEVEAGHVRHPGHNQHQILVVSF